MNPHGVNPKSVTIAGAGLAGTLMAVLLGRRGVAVRLIERRPDPRVHALSAGRSINLALADRGLHALHAAGLEAAVRPLLIPMRGRMLHDLNGAQHFVPYGQRPHEVIYSISRPGLNQLLLDEAEKLPQVALQFEYEIEQVELKTRRLTLRHAQHQQTELLAYDTLIAADGYRSIVRQHLLQHLQVRADDQLLPHGYKELTLPATADGRHQLDPNALHLWPRGGFMLIGLPNQDGTFTMTLFLPFESDAQQPHSFATLRDPAAIREFFATHFADAAALMPQLGEEFLAHPVGRMHTIRSPRWSDHDHTVLIGDAAHAIVPFHGQGMNCAFEDCTELDTLMQRLPFNAACRDFERLRKPSANAIADMALENYLEMRDTVREPRFLLQKELSFELERRFPERFIPRYSMVMFHHEVSYAIAQQRGQAQAEILDHLTRDASDLSQVDMQQAAQLVSERLAPLVAG